MGSHVSYHSPTMAELSTPAPPKDGRMGISGAAQLPIMRQTRNILSVQTIQVSLPREKHCSEKNPFLNALFLFAAI